MSFASWISTKYDCYSSTGQDGDLNSERPIPQDAVALRVHCVGLYRGSPWRTTSFKPSDPRIRRVTADVGVDRFGNFDAAPLLTTVFLLLAYCGDVHVKAQKHLVERKYPSTTTHSKRCGPLFAPTSIHSHIMVSLVDAQQYPPPTDLQTDAVRLCIAFQSQLNPEFLGAATELLSCVATLSPADFRRHSRKTRRAGVDDSLRARTNSLLVRLSSNFVGRQSAVASSNSPARTSLPDKSRKSLALGITTCTPQPESGNTTAARLAMPAPDAFPPRAPQSFPRRKRTSPLLPFRVPSAVMSSRKRARHSTRQENEIPTPEPSSVTYAYKPPPLTKRFGIFCTGKSSMHQYRRRRCEFIEQRAWGIEALRSSAVH
ncbi:hypothetical protein B0H14DRAFT_3673927 [Mycena olivaceomarginata]|nr:hypothetical protein B0H14DRAFT_3673927 [Mycena olivaceomarginata]